ncbi:hypothetical protein HI914_07058 [Erysiphe necator]|nr:hypothetical protein HI914_07058 [Erysiphe necator]
MGNSRARRTFFQPRANVAFLGCVRMRASICDSHLLKAGGLAAIPIYNLTRWIKRIQIHDFPTSGCRGRWNCNDKSTIPSWGKANSQQDQCKRQVLKFYDSDAGRKGYLEEDSPE